MLCSQKAWSWSDAWQPCEVILTARCLGLRPLVTIPVQRYLLGPVSPRPLLSD